MNRRMLSILALCAMWISTIAVHALAASDDAKAAVRKFEHAELFGGTSTGQKKAGGSTKGALVFDTEKKIIEFEAQKGSEVVSIPYRQVKSLLYEQASKPRIYRGSSHFSDVSAGAFEEALSDHSIHRCQRRWAVRDRAAGQEKCAAGDGGRTS